MNGIKTNVLGKDCGTWDEEWDEEAQKDWEEKMNQPVSFRKISEEELQKLKEAEKE